MLEIFYTEDGTYHQAILFCGSKELVNLCVDKLITQEHEPVGWDWMVWAANTSWSEPDTTWFGTERTLKSAKLAALDAAVVLADQIYEGARSTSKTYEYSMAS